MAWVERAAVNWGHWDLRSWLDRPLPEQVLGRFSEDQASFDIRFLEDLLARMGEAPDILMHLGYLYTRANRYREALAVDRRIVTLRPRDPTAHYNLACSFSLLNHVSRGIQALRKALELGYRDTDQLQTDTDLENLRKDPRWADLMSAMKA